MKFFVNSFPQKAFSQSSPTYSHKTTDPVSSHIAQDTSLALRGEPDEAMTLSHLRHLDMGLQFREGFASVGSIAKISAVLVRKLLQGSGTIQYIYI